MLDGQVLSCAVYEGEGDAAEAARFLARCARDLPVPETCVLDAAYVVDRGWALLEANAAWGAGLNGCDPAAAALCIDAAARVAWRRHTSRGIAAGKRTWSSRPTRELVRLALVTLVCCRERDAIVEDGLDF